MYYIKAVVVFLAFLVGFWLLYCIVRKIFNFQEWLSPFEMLKEMWRSVREGTQDVRGSRNQKANSYTTAKSNSALAVTGASALGAAAGGTVYCTVGGAGLAMAGTAVSIGLLPMMITGAIVGAAGLSIVKVLQK